MPKQRGRVVLLAEQHLNTDHLQAIQMALPRLKKYVQILAIEQAIPRITSDFFNIKAKADAAHMRRAVSLFAHRYSLPDPTQDAMTGSQLKKVVDESWQRIQAESIRVNQYIQWPYGEAFRDLVGAALKCSISVRGFDVIDRKLDDGEEAAVLLTSVEVSKHLEETVAFKDEFMAGRLDELSREGNVFAIVGEAHLNGIYQHLLDREVDVCPVIHHDPELSVFKLTELIRYTLLHSELRPAFLDSLDQVFNKRSYAYRITGLKKAVQLNGQIAYFVRHLKGGRVAVRVEQEGEHRLVDIKETNLQPLHAVSSLSILPLPDGYRDEPEPKGRCCGFRC